MDASQQAAEESVVADSAADVMNVAEAEPKQEPKPEQQAQTEEVGNKTEDKVEVAPVESSSKVEGSGVDNVEQSIDSVKLEQTGEKLADKLNELVVDTATKEVLEETQAKPEQSDSPVLVPVLTNEEALEKKTEKVDEVKPEVKQHDEIKPAEATDEVEKAKKGPAADSKLCEADSELKANVNEANEQLEKQPAVEAASTDSTSGIVSNIIAEEVSNESEHQEAQIDELLAKKVDELVVESVQSALEAAASRGAAEVEKVVEQVAQLVAPVEDEAKEKELEDGKVESNEIKSSQEIEPIPEQKVQLDEKPVCEPSLEASSSQVAQAQDHKESATESHEKDENKENATSGSDSIPEVVPKLEQEPAAADKPIEAEKEEKSVEEQKVESQQAAPAESNDDDKKEALPSPPLESSDSAEDKKFGEQNQSIEPESATVGKTDENANQSIDSIVGGDGDKDVKVPELTKQTSESIEQPQLNGGDIQSVAEAAQSIASSIETVEKAIASVEQAQS